MPPAIKRIAKTYLRDPQEVTVAAKTGTAENITQRYWLVSGMQKLEALTRILGLPGRQDLWGGGEYNVDLRGFGITSDSNQVIVLDGVRMTWKARTGGEPGVSVRTTVSRT